VKPEKFQTAGAGSVVTSTGTSTVPVLVVVQRGLVLAGGSAGVEAAVGVMVGFWGSNTSAKHLLKEVFKSCRKSTP
jgi:hypothetical protein